MATSNFISIFDLFKIGIGPSSSHTIGPMRAANFFCDKLQKHHCFEHCDRIQVILYGSLALTGIGHGTDGAIIAGLAGELPEQTAREKVQALLVGARGEKKIWLQGKRELVFDYQQDLLFNPESLPFHPNGISFFAFADGQILYQKIYYSVGGGFVVGQKSAEEDLISPSRDVEVPYPFSSGKELLALCRQNKATIAEIVWANELALRRPEEVRGQLQAIYAAMEAAIKRGVRADGVLPGRLQIKRRAKKIYQQLKSSPQESLSDPLTILDWVNLYALAVNEENAAGGRIVTAPTNGAAGIIPAVLFYHLNFGRQLGKREQVVETFLLTAGAIGILYKLNASISGAEVGCQGEVGVACSMAAAALAAVQGGAPEQVENAAEIGMEHNLGLTCDPLEGQVQIPCIERNAMGAVKAINGARLALRGSGKHFVSLDQVMKTMKETGMDMQDKYKETAKGGLAINITEC